jgi:hypothetical protein
MQSRSALKQGEAEYKAAEYNRGMALHSGSAEMARRHRIGRRKIGHQAAQIGKSGVLMEGSILDRLAQNAAEYEVDALNAMWEAQQESEIHRKRGRVAWGQARSSAGAALLSGVTGALGTAAKVK